jgi:hypothetical protein
MYFVTVIGPFKFMFLQNGVIGSGAYWLIIPWTKVTWKSQLASVSSCRNVKRPPSALMRYGERRPMEIEHFKMQAAPFSSSDLLLV